MKKIVNTSENSESSEKKLLFLIMILIFIVLTYWEIVGVRCLYLNQLFGNTSLSLISLLWVIANTAVLSIQVKLTIRLLHEIRNDLVAN